MPGVEIHPSRISSRNLNTGDYHLADDNEESDLDHPEYYMSNSFIEKVKNDKTLTEHDIMIIQRLACRKFHIPGQTFWEDYQFWFCNNHPFFCFCYADKRHPFGRTERVLNLISSLAFGLAATCCVVLWYHYHRTVITFNTPLFTVMGYDIQAGMVTLFAFRYVRLCITCFSAFCFVEENGFFFLFQLEIPANCSRSKQS